MQLVNGETVIVEQVQHELLENPETLYNFSVDGNHNYYVAESVKANVCDFVLAHNNGCGFDDEKPDSPDKISEDYIKNNGIDAHSFKKNFAKGESASHFNMYKDKTTGIVWLKNNRFNTWINTETLFDDLIEDWSF